MLMAGIDGIKHKIDPASRSTKTFRIDAEEAASIPSMPGSLDEALGELSKITSFCWRATSFTKEFIELWINYKKKNESDPVRMRRIRMSSILLRYLA